MHLAIGRGTLAGQTPLSDRLAPMLKSLALGTLLFAASMVPGQAWAEENPELKFSASGLATYTPPAAPLAGLREKCGPVDADDGRPEADIPACQSAVVSVFDAAGVLDAAVEDNEGAQSLVSLLGRTEALADAAGRLGLGDAPLNDAQTALSSMIDQGELSGCNDAGGDADPSEACIHGFLIALGEVSTAISAVLLRGDPDVETRINEAWTVPRAPSLPMEQIGEDRDRLVALGQARSAYTALIDGSDGYAPMLSELDALTEKIVALQRLDAARHGLGVALHDGSSTLARIPHDETPGPDCNHPEIEQCRSEFIGLINALVAHNQWLDSALTISLSAANAELSGTGFSRDDLIWSEEVIGFASPATIPGEEGAELVSKFNVIRAALTEPSPQPTMLESVVELASSRAVLIAVAAVLLLAALWFLLLYFRTPKVSGDPKVDYQSVDQKWRRERALKMGGEHSESRTAIPPRSPGLGSVQDQRQPTPAVRAPERLGDTTQSDIWHPFAVLLDTAAGDKRTGYLVNPDSNAARAVSRDLAPRHEHDDEDAVRGLIKACRNQQFDQLGERIPALVSLFNRLLAEAQRMDEVLKAREAQDAQSEQIRAAAATTAEALDALFTHQVKALEQNDARNPGSGGDGHHPVTVEISKLRSAFLASASSGASTKSTAALATQVARSVREAGSHYASKFSALADEFNDASAKNRDFAQVIKDREAQIDDLKRNLDSKIEEARRESREESEKLSVSNAAKDGLIESLSAEKADMKKVATEQSAKLTTLQARIADFERGEPTVVSESAEITELLSLADNRKTPEGDRVRALFRVLDSASTGRMTRDGVERTCIILGEQVFSMLEATGSAGVERAEAARPFMKAANVLLDQANLGEDRLEVFIPRIGDQPDIERMTRPRGRAMTVSDVLGWGLRSDRSVVHKAVVAYS